MLGRIIALLMKLGELQRLVCKMDIVSLLEEFADLIRNEEVEVYNEFSLQHELGIFLRAKLTGNKVQFERNTKFFGITGTVKHEIDIVIYNENEKYAIELKYPLNGQYPEQMYSFIKDIKFMEQLKEAGFDGAYCMTLVRDKNFYSGNKVDGVYSYFRNGNTIHGTIINPTGKKDESIDVHGEYQVEWKSINNWKYYIVDM